MKKGRWIQMISDDRRKASTGEWNPLNPHNSEQVKRAASYLGIIWPVDLRPVPAHLLFYCNGYLCERTDPGRHRVYIHPYRDPLTASHLIWHELTHARQAEMVGSVQELHRQAFEYTGGVHPADLPWLEYRNLPYEAEAFYMEENAPFALELV